MTLFERTSRALLLTQSGVELLAHFRTMGDAANAISVAATGQSEAVTGHVLISATDMMATYFLPSILKKLRITAPDLQIEIIASHEVSDLRRREADIAIRHGRPTDEALFAKRLRDTTAHLFASNKYLDEVGRPKTLADLEKLTFVGFDQPELRLGLMASRGVNLTTANFNFSTSSGTLMLEFVRQGFGIGILPVEVGAAYPELENPYSAFEPLRIETWLVAHRELKTNLRIRVVFDLLAEGIG